MTSSQSKAAEKCIYTDINITSLLPLSPLLSSSLPLSLSPLLSLSVSLLFSPSQSLFSSLPLSLSPLLSLSVSLLFSPSQSLSSSLPLSLSPLLSLSVSHFFLYCSHTRSPLSFPLFSLYCLLPPLIIYLLQYSTAQYSTGHYSTAQRSTVQHNTRPTKYYQYSKAYHIVQQQQDISQHSVLRYNAAQYDLQYAIKFNAAKSHPIRHNSRTKYTVHCNTVK
jgi:hypothetical protein